LNFAKDLFTSWDVSGDGTISEDEVIKPLVSLGLVPDHKFARKIWQSLKPPKSGDEEQVELTSDEFLRIFRYDTIQEKLMKQLEPRQKF
jgi:Ca2+-binding EF-hand superfamily protein